MSMADPHSPLHSCTLRTARSHRGVPCVCVCVLVRLCATQVSMGAYAARKALEVIENVETVIAIEILAACQAVDLHRPLKTTPPLEALHALVRRVAAPWVKDRQMSPDIDAVHELVRSGAALEAVENALGK